jgi:hypothetical protein
MKRSTATLVAIGFAGALAICLSWSGFKELQADTYRLLYSGRWIAQHGIPHHEVFTLAARGGSFADQQWLSELIDYQAFGLAGYSGLALLAAVVFGSAFALLAALMRRRGASVVVAVAGATLAIFGTLSLTFIRAQIFALPLFVALLWLCLEESGQPRPRLKALLVLPLLALWANLHGSVLIGAALAGAYLGYRAVVMARRRRRRSAGGYAALAAAAVLTPLATPYGSHVLAYYHSMIGNHAVAVADIEWGPPAFGTLAFIQFVAPLALALVSVLAARSKGHRPRPELLGAVCLTALAAAFAMRNDVWLGIASALLVAETASAWLPTRAPAPRFVGALALAGAALAVLGVGRLLTRSNDGFQSQAPLGAIAATASYAASHPCARVLADNVGASALLWLEPKLAGRVGFDGELEAYPQAALVDWVKFQAAAGSDWLAAARGYQLLIGTTTSQPARVRRLSVLRTGIALAHDTRGIAVLDPAATPAAGCPSSEATHA